MMSAISIYICLAGLCVQCSFFPPCPPPPHSPSLFSHPPPTNYPNSPDQYQGPDPPVPTPLGSAGGASSLPDLTNIEFSSGLDVPIERDDFVNEQQPLPKLGPYHSPPVTSKGPGPGPSKLIFSSFQANPFGTTLPSMLPPPPQYSSTMPPSYGLPNLNPGFNQHPHSVQYPPPPPFGVRKSPTMPDFRTLSTNAPSVTSFTAPQMSNPTPQFRPILPSYPNTNHLRAYRPPPATIPSFMPQVNQVNPNIPPPMTIIIQPPVNNTTPSLVGTSTKQPLPPPQIQQPAPSSQPNSVNPPPNSIGNADHGAPHPGPFTVADSPTKSTLTNSLPNTPTITIGSGLPHLAALCNLPALPSYLEAKQQQALQQKFASINVGKSEPLIRSHSEENLQKAQKEKGDMVTNPFMGNLANASSVPCVYVDTDQQVERSDSPTTVDSPSTSASYASSPPSVRPFWLDQPHSINDYVFQEWPMESGTDKPKPGSPLIHHKSLTDLSTIPEVTENSPSNRLLHQLSLPSIVMGDLTVDEQIDKQSSPTFMPSDFEMEEAVMDSLLKEEVADLQPFDVNFMVTETLMSSSPDSFLHNRLHF